MSKESLRYRAWKKLIQTLTYPSYHQVSKLVSTDWDILIVLDACRYDTLNQYTSLAQPTESPASSTPEWIDTMDTHGIFDNTTIVTGNPQYKLNNPTTQNQLVGLWDSYWHRELNTALPEIHFETAHNYIYATDNPVVIHLVQPHWPYLVRAGDHWIHALDTQGVRPVVESAQVAMESGMFDMREVYAAYQASVQSIWTTVLERVGEYVTDGYSVVVTSDHGECFGRVRDYGFFEHPSRCHIKPLTRVPFVSFLPASQTSEEGFQEKLRALGYA